MRALSVLWRLAYKVEQRVNKFSCELASHTYRLLGTSRPLIQRAHHRVVHTGLLDLPKPCRTVDAGPISDGSLQAHTAYSPPLALTSISHPLDPSRDQEFWEIHSLMDAGRIHSRDLLTLACVLRSWESLWPSDKSPKHSLPILVGSALSFPSATYTRQIQHPGQLPYLLPPWWDGI